MLRTDRFSGSGLFMMDEPEAGLSFTSQLALLGELLDGPLQEPGAQVVIATHSPILAALPGARILELDEDGIHPRQWDELDMVDHYRRFIEAPERYLRHLR